MFAPIPDQTKVSQSSQLRAAIALRERSNSLEKTLEIHDTGRSLEWRLSCKNRARRF
jgi:hypothetical protein